MKILVINTGSSGEIVYTTPLLRALKAHSEMAIVHFLTSTEGVTHLEENPNVDKVFNYAAGRMQTYKQLRKTQYDIIIDLDGLNLFSFLVPGEVYRFNKRSLANWLLTRLKINKLSSTHLADQYLETVLELGLKTDGFRVDYFIPYKDEVPSDWLPAEVQKNFVVFCLSAPYGTRALPVKRMIELCDKINKPIILIGSGTESGIGSQIEDFFSRTGTSVHLEEGLKELNKKTIVYNACGKFSVHQQASLIKQARYVFTFDNDLVPIASAFGKETFLLLGNTVTSFGRYPYHTRFTILENNRLSCRPCSVTGYKKCPLKHFKCMNEIVFDFYLP